MAAMNDRGQMLLIGAIVMAVSFVALGIVLNGSFHTPTIASEASEDVSSGKIDAIERSIQDDLESLIIETIENNPSSSAAQSSRMSVYTTQLSSLSDRYFADGDAFVEISTPPAVAGPIVGTRISHTGGEFTSTPNPVPVVQNGRVRSFTMSSLSFTGAGPFEMRIDGDQYDWRVFLQDAPGGVEVRVVGGPNSIDEVCTAGATTINFGESTIGTSSEHCTALAHLDDIEPPYKIQFINGDQIEGEYDMVAVGSISAPSAATTQSRLYGVEYDLSIQGIEESIETTTLAAPGEFHD